VPKTLEGQETEQRNYKILLVDDNSRILDITSKALECEGYQVTTVLSGEAAIKTLSSQHFDLVVTDLNLGAVNGISVLKKAKEMNPTKKVIIMTGNFDINFAIEALRHNADDYMLKPFNLNDFLDRVSHYFEELSPLGLNYTTHTEIT